MITVKNLISQGVSLNAQQVSPQSLQLWAGKQLRRVEREMGHSSLPAGSVCCGARSGCLVLVACLAASDPLVSELDGFLNLTSSFVSLPLSLNVLFDEKEGAEGISQR